MLINSFSAPDQTMLQIYYLTKIRKNNLQVKKPNKLLLRIIKIPNKNTKLSIVHFSLFLTIVASDSSKKHRTNRHYQRPDNQKVYSVFFIYACKER